MNTHRVERVRTARTTFYVLTQEVCTFICIRFIVHDDKSIVCALYNKISNKKMYTPRVKIVVKTNGLLDFIYYCDSSVHKRIEHNIE